MKIYTFEDLRGRPERQTFEEAATNLERLVYFYENQLKRNRPENTSIAEMLSRDPSEIFIYGHGDTGTKRPLRRTYEQLVSWPLRMVMSYRALHPEQSLWFNIKTVSNLQSLDMLQNDPSFEAESWVHVEDVGDGTSAEYVLAADRSFWVNAGILDKEIPSGKEALYELFERLSSGYLYDTFGPNGQNRNACDFLYLFYRTGSLAERAWNKSGATIRWDFGDDLVDFNGIPEQAAGTDPIATCSAEDDFSGIDNMRVNGGLTVTFKGAPPRLNTSSVTTMTIQTSVFGFTQFAGKFPLIDTSNMVQPDYLGFRSGRFTSIPSLDFSSAESDLFELFAFMVSVTKIAPLSFPKATGFVGTFRALSITEFPRILEASNVIDIANMFQQCGRLPSKMTAADLRWLSSDKNINMGSAFASTNITESSSGKLFSDNITSVSDAFTQSKIVDANIASLLGLTDIEVGSMSPFIYAHDLSQKTIDLFLKRLYEARFVHKQNATQPFFGIYLGTVKHQPSGTYQDSDEPSTGMEYMYKLVENPDDDDINDYYIVLPEKEYVEEDEYSKVDISLSGDNTFTLRLDLLFIGINRPITIDWGDGTEDTFVYNAEQANEWGNPTNVDIPHEYASDGEYTITTRGISIIHDQYQITANRNKITRVVLGYSGTHPFLWLDGFRAMPNLEEIRGTHPLLVSGIWLRDAFRDCTSLKHIDPIYCFETFGTINALRIFQNTGSIESAKLIGMNRTFSIANNQLNGEALNDLFDGLADITNGDAATVTVTGNPGIIEPAYDPTIATDKGWTVVD